MGAHRVVNQIPDAWVLRDILLFAAGLAVRILDDLYLIILQSDYPDPFPIVDISVIVYLEIP